MRHPLCLVQRLTQLAIANGGHADGRRPAERTDRSASQRITRDTNNADAPGHELDQRVRRHRLVWLTGDGVACPADDRFGR